MRVVEDVQNSQSLAARGFLHVPSLGLTDQDLREVRTLLDGLFGRLAQLPTDLAHDLAGDSISAARVAVPEINRTTALEPRLLKTRAYAAMTELAKSLLGPGTYRNFDHAIYKPPGLSARTQWHQDSAYASPHTSGLALWLPLQDVTVETGCMQFVPESHLSGPQTHLQRATTDGKIIKYLEPAEGSAVAVPMRAGGVTAHLLNTVHGTAANTGVEVRRAWIIDYSSAPSRVRLARQARLFAEHQRIAYRVRKRA